MSCKFSLLTAIVSEDTIRSFAYSFINGTYELKMPNMVQAFIYMNQLLSDPYEYEKFNASELLENVEGYLYTILSSNITFNLRKAVIKFMGSLVDEINKKQTYTLKNHDLIRLLLENGVLYGYGKWQRDPDFIYHPMDNTETIFRQHVKYVFDNFAKGHTYDELPKNLSNFNSMIHIFYDIMVSIMSRMGDDLLKHYRFTIEFDKLNRLENNVLGMLLPAIMPYSEHEEFEDDLVKSDYVLIMRKITTKLLLIINEEFCYKIPKKGGITKLVKDEEKRKEFKILHQNLATFINTMCIDTAVEKENKHL